MAYSAGERLAAFSRAVRGSTLKRLHAVPPGAESWRTDPEAMSIADLAKHLIDADRWLFNTLAGKRIPTVQGRAGVARIEHRAEYVELLDGLEETGAQRDAILESMSESQFAEAIADPRFDGDVTAWWTIVRGNLDHEIHHRGQLAAWLRAMNRE